MCINVCIYIYIYTCIYTHTYKSIYPPVLQVDLAVADEIVLTHGEHATLGPDLEPQDVCNM